MCKGPQAVIRLADLRGWKAEAGEGQRQVATCCLRATETVWTTFWEEWGNFQKPRVRKSDSSCGFREPMGYCAVRLGSRMFFHLWS